MNTIELKNFNDINDENKTIIANQIKIDCENEIKNLWQGRSLKEIVESYGVTWESLNNEYDKSQITSWDGIFFGIEFPFCDYLEDYISSTIQLINARKYLFALDLLDELLKSNQIDDKMWCKIEEWL